MKALKSKRISAKEDQNHTKSQKLRNTKENKLRKANGTKRNRMKTKEANLIERFQFETAKICLEMWNELVCWKYFEYIVVSNDDFAPIRREFHFWVEDAVYLVQNNEKLEVGGLLGPNVLTWTSGVLSGRFSIWEFLIYFKMLDRSNQNQFPKRIRLSFFK